jgi:DNA-binding SARP family transcriptional activator
MMPRNKLGSSAVALTLTGEFELAITGRLLTIPHSVERVLAYLALSDRPVSRTRIAGSLWSESPEHRAAKSLRTALWTLHRVGADLVSTNDNRLRLHPDVAIDVAELTDLARTLIHEPTVDTLDKIPLLIRHVDLLPDWDEDWVGVERERYRLLRLEALESATAALLDRRRWAEALVAGLAAVQSEPLRESARRLVVQGQIAQGNVAEALRGYRDFRRLLLAEFGVEPSLVMEELLAPWRGVDGGLMLKGLATDAGNAPLIHASSRDRTAQSRRRPSRNP